MYITNSPFIYFGLRRTSASGVVGVCVLCEHLTHLWGRHMPILTKGVSAHELRKRRTAVVGLKRREYDGYAYDQLDFPMNQVKIAFVGPFNPCENRLQ